MKQTHTFLGFKVMMTTRLILQYCVFLPNHLQTMIPVGISQIRQSLKNNLILKRNDDGS